MEFNMPVRPDCICCVYQEEAYFPLEEGYTFVETVPVEERTRGTQQPEKFEDCEVTWHNSYKTHGQLVYLFIMQ